MTLVVQKFGGSSLSDMGKLGSVADGIAARRRAGDDVAVVVSAMGKATEGLLGLAREAASARPGFEPPRREVDMLVSTGERVSMALLSIALQARGVPAVSFTGSQSGILTTGRHFDARIVEVRPERVQSELARGKVVIVAGYQGMSREREITTLGRGGSDTTAVALASALGAEHCEIYSDVDGVYTADPNRVPGARHLPAIDYETMEEMASAGARVLNVHAVRTAREHGLCVLARRTADFVGSATGRETRVVAGANPVSAIVVDMTLALAYGSSELRAPLREAANLAELPLRELDLGDRLPLAAIPLGGVPDAAGALETLKRALPELLVVSGFAELSLVGAAARLGRETAALDALPVVPLCAWQTPRRHSALLPLEHVADAERRWHDLFVESAGSAPDADALGH